MDFEHLYLDFNGRIGRQTWWIGALVMMVAAIVASVILGLVFGPNFAALIVNLAVLYPAAALIAKRLHDHGMETMPWVAVLLGPSLLATLLSLIGITGSTAVIGNQTVFMPNALGWLLNLIVTLVGLFSIYLLGIKKGQEGSNQFGADPLAA